MQTNAPAASKLFRAAQPTGIAKERAKERASGSLAGSCDECVNSGERDFNDKRAAIRV
jgi:hypothetical protein